MIQHTVVFKLKHASGSPDETSFLQAAQKLASIPGVLNFKCLRQTSKQNQFDFGISMEFATQADYDQYSRHPLHQQQVTQRWIPEVSNFLEIDYVPLQQ